MDPFVAQLADLCKAHPTRAKWVFVPTHAIGRTIGDRIALAGTDWVNLRFVTPFEIALRMGAPFLVERGIDPSEEGLGPALVMRLLLHLPERDGYFRPLAGQPSMASALWSTIRELRMTGLRSSDLAAEHFESRLKHAELVALLAAYESFLTAHARGDRATVFQEALQHVDWCPIQAPDCWTMLPDFVWSPLEGRLLDVTPGEHIVPKSIALPGLEAPRRLRPFATDRIAPAASNALAYLTRPEGFSQSTTSATTFFHAGSAEAEVEEVFRRILTSGVPLDRVEIVCGAPTYGALLWEKALRYDWPVTIGHGIAAVVTRPGRTLLAFIEWIEDDFTAGKLRRIFESGDVRLGDNAGIAPGRAARLLVQAEAAWGRDTYRIALGRLAKTAHRVSGRDDLSSERRESMNQRATDAASLAEWIDSLITLIPPPDEAGLVDLQSLAHAARTFVNEHIARTSALDHVAAAALNDAIAELEGLGPFRCPLVEALRFIRERTESVAIAADRPRPGHLFVAPLTDAGWSGRPHVFVVGLEEGRVFPLAIEDPVLLDVERTQIHDALLRSPDRTHEAVHAALARLAAVTARPDAQVTLSYACRDVREYRQTFPSWVLLQAFRVFSGQAQGTFHDLLRHLSEPVSIVPKTSTAALDECRWWLHGVTRAGEAAREAIIARYPALAAGISARESRDSADFTEFDGHVPAAGAALDPGLPGAVISPTQLEDAAECPFRHFLKRGLGVDAIESGERDRDIWLNPLLRGSLLHDLYAALLRRCRTDRRRAATNLDGPWLHSEGTRLLAALAIEMPPPSIEIRDRETSLLLEDLALFLEAEAALPTSRTPIGFEVAFGRADDGGAEPLAQPEPVVISIGDLTLRIAGRIDRIDQVGPSTFEIIDYKTGGYFGPNWKGTFAGGTRLQHALYGLAAVALLRRLDPNATVAAAEYYFSSAKGGQERKRIPTPSLAAIGRVLDDLRQVIASGLFVHAPNETACNWCNHGLACGRGVHGRAEAKRADARLEAFVRLAEHE